MFIAVAASVGMGLLNASEQRKANSQARDAADKANTDNNKLRDLAMPYMQDNLKTNAAMQKFYQDNPFNDQQKRGYQNQNNLIDSFNGQVAPQMLNFANGLMGSNYQRQRGTAPGSAYGGLLQGGMHRDNPEIATGLSTSSPIDLSGQDTSGLGNGFRSALGNGFGREFGSQLARQTGGTSNPFIAPQYQALGQIDFDKMNPHRNYFTQGEVGPPNPNVQQNPMGRPPVMNNQYLGHSYMQER